MGNLTSPADGASLGSGTDINVVATASDPDGSIAKVEFYIDGRKFRSDATAPYSFVWSNAASGAYVLTAIATDNAGGTTASTPVTITVTNRLAGTNTLISQGYFWKYLDNGSNQGTAWREPAFADAAWAAGVAQLGYGDGDEATVIGFGPSASAKYITTYFRYAWNVPDPGIYNSLILKLLRDDGAVVYLNGREVFRSNMPAGTVSASTFATASIGGSGERTFYSSIIAATNLVAGTNVIAVEVHQDDLASSDVSFDFQLLATSGAVAPALTRGPYLQGGTTNSIILRWRTDLPGSSTVRLGTNAANLDQEIAGAASTTEHIVPLTGLAADTRYFYSIETGSNLLASGPDFFFVTSPLTGSQRPVRLWVLGDSGDADNNARNVANGYLTYAAASQPADIWLMLGDNAYDDGTDAEYQAAVFDMYPSVLRNRVLWPTIGNHDTAQQTALANFPYLDMFSLPQNGEAGGVPSGTERYYSFDYGNIHFICLDSMTSSRSASGPMAQWLQTDLANTVQPWVIAFWHHPPYTKGNHNSDTESQLIQMRQNILPILENAGVDLVLCGHSHVYERSYFLREHYGSSWTLTDDMKIDGGNGREAGTGAYRKAGSAGSVYTVCGSSGHTSSGPLNHPAMFISMRVLGSLVIDVSSNRLDLGFLGTNATLLDHFTIIKGTNAEPPAAPANLAATLVASDRVRLTWNNSSTTELGYELERSVDGASFSLFATLGANLTNFTNGLLLPSTVYSYRVRATNTSGASDYSNVATSTTPGAPRIVSGPDSTNVLQGSVANFGVSAAGTTPLGYQWRFNGTDLPNQTNATLTLLNAQPPDAGSYSVLVTNMAGSVISTDAVLTVIIPPTITSQPQSQIVTIGSSAAFSVTATGTAPLRYQWRFNGANILNATNATLTIVPVEEGNAGSYAVIVANGGFAVSSNAVLAVNHPPVAGNYTAERLATQGVKFRARVLTGTDPDGDPTTLESVDPTSAQSGNVSRLGEWVIYSPPPGFTNADAFSYELRDSHGASATGTVTILPADNSGVAANLIVEDRNDGSFRLRFSGIPGRLYTIQTADHGANPIWQVLAAQTAGADGSFEYIDTPVPKTATRYYRSTYP